MSSIYLNLSNVFLIKFYIKINFNFYLPFFDTKESQAIVGCLFWLSFDGQRAPLQDLNSYLEFMETIVKAKPEAKVETIFKMNFLKYNLFFDFAGFLS